MADWIERIVWRNTGVEFVPLLICLALVFVVWAFQGRRGRKGGSIKVGWGPGVAIAALVVLGVAAIAVTSGLGAQAWWLIGDQPWLAAWWVIGVGVVIAVWGVAVHAWRKEARLARQCRCGYDMSAVSGMRCPECGREARSERQLRRYNVRTWALWLGSAVIACGLLLPTGVEVLRRGPAAALPSRTLLWWISSTGSPPAGLMQEVIYRAGADPEQWRARLKERGTELAERLLECDPGVRTDYVALLREAGSLETALLIAKSLESPDPERRRSAAAYLGSGVMVPTPLKVVEPLLNDPDPATQANARVILATAVSEIMLRLTGKDGKPAESDPKRIAELVRMLCLVPANTWYTQPQDLDAACASTDPETAARAAIIRARWSVATQVGSAEVLRAALLGVRTLRSMKIPAVAGGVTVALWIGYPETRSWMIKLIDDPDPAVRVELLTELDGLATTWAPYFRSGQETVWSQLEGPLRSRLASESDPQARALIQSILKSMSGGGGAAQ